MPRVATSSKRPQGAAAPNQRDTRHENGLVGPGRRVASRKSQNQLEAVGNGNGNGHAGGHGNGRPVDRQHGGQNGTAQPSASGSDLATAGTSAPAAAVGLDPTPPSALLPATNGTKGHVDLGEPLRRGSLGGYSESSSSAESLHLANGGGGGAVAEPAHRQIDVNATKNANVHRDSGPLDIATTVLKALPLYDTLAILLVLMQVPPMVLSGIYMIFTCITYVRPVTTSSGMNINIAEIFDGNSTMPSLVTVLCMDLFILLIWLFLWTPIQHAILDFAKPVIAVTLGGAAGSRDGSSRNATTCFLLVAVAHLARGTRFHWTRAARLLPPQWGLYADADPDLEGMSRGFDRRGPHGWIKSVLAIHILTQGIVRYIREWYIRREKANASNHGLGDPEAGKLPSLGEGMETGFATPDTDTSFQVSAAPSTKKKRKLSTQVRLQQPLWSALASTKIVVVKEIELSRTAGESAGTNATDIHNLGNAPFDKQPAQIWVSYVGFDEVCFGTSHFCNQPSLHDFATAPDGGPQQDPAARTEPAAPFYVKVNSAVWQPTRMYRVGRDVDERNDEADGLRQGAEGQATDGTAHGPTASGANGDSDGEEDSNDVEEGLGSKWSGDIYGLRPMSNYVLEFVDTRTDEVIFRTSVRTKQAPSKAPDGSSKPEQSGRRPFRPDSPSTTMKTSIAAAEVKLSEEKEKLKKMRKEGKSKVNSLRKDIERLDNALQSAGSNDDKLRQKVQQHEAQKAQAEKEADQLEARIRELEVAPDGLAEAKRAAEKRYLAEKALFEAAQKQFNEHRARLDAAAKEKTDDQQTLQTRRDKISARIAKVDGELERIADANSRGLDEAERRRQETAAFQAEAARIERAMEERVAQLRAANEVRVDQSKKLLTQLSSFHEQHFSYVSNTPAAAAYDGYHPQTQQQQPQQPQFSNPLNASSHSLNPAAMPYQGSAMWPPPPTTSSASLSSLATHAPGPIGHPASMTWPTSLSLSAMGTHAFSSGPAGFKARGRSSSMLSQVSGFTQSSAAEEEGPGPAPGPGPSGGGGTAYSAFGATVRGPLGFQLTRARQRSDGESGSGRSSVRSGSGSGSGGSLRDPTSPA